MENERFFEEVQTDGYKSLRVEWRQMGVDKAFGVLWTLKGFSSYKEEQVILSSPFNISPYSDLEDFQIMLWPNEDHHISVALFTKNKITISYEFKIRSCRELLDPRIFSEGIEFDGSDKLIKHKILNRGLLGQYFTDDTLKVQCKIQINPKLDSPLVRQTLASITNLVSDLGRMRAVPGACDVTLIAKSKRIPAQKCILSARSPVFKAMFSSGMMESLGNTVEINDLDEAVVEEMVDYIYTGSSPNLSVLAAKLVLAADKYEISCLKGLCQLQMIKDMTIDNLVEFHKLSMLLDMEELREKCLFFISKNGRELLKRRDFNEFIEDNENINEILKYCFNLLSTKCPAKYINETYD